MLYLMTLNSLISKHEDATEKLKFNNLSDPDSDDDDTQPEIVADGNDVNNDGDHGGNIDFNGESTNTGEESSRNVGNNSGGDIIRIN